MIATLLATLLGSSSTTATNNIGNELTETTSGLFLVETGTGSNLLES